MIQNPLPFHHAAEVLVDLCDELIDRIGCLSQFESCYSLIWFLLAP